MPKPKAPKAKLFRQVFDEECRAAVKLHPNVVVAWWLMAGYLYYVHDESILSDACYDWLARSIVENWHSIAHPHKHLLPTPGDESIVHGFGIKCPTIVRSAACRLVEERWGIGLDDNRQ